jgi:hypothetical protein
LDDLYQVCASSASPHCKTTQNLPPGHTMTVSFNLRQDLLPCALARPVTSIVSCARERESEMLAWPVRPDFDRMIARHWTFSQV